MFPGMMDIFDGDECLAVLYVVEGDAVIAYSFSFTKRYGNFFADEFELLVLYFDGWCLFCGD